MSLSNPATTRLSPPARWDRIVQRLVRSRVDFEAMRDVYLPSDARAEATRRYTAAADAILHDLNALEQLRALDDVAELLNLTYGDG